MQATREAYAEWPETTLWMAAGETFNPRVLGSNPSRPSSRLCLRVGLAQR